MKDKLKMNNEKNKADYFDQALNWETDRYQQAKKSAKLAWVVAIFACLVALSSGVAVMGLTPLKTVEPYVIRVDSATGIPDIITALKDEKTTYDEVVSKYFLAQYVISRESYSFNRREHDYTLVGLMSSPVQASKYGEWYNPKNPSSPLVLYGESGTSDVKIKNITFLDKDVALVRFVKSVTRANEVLKSDWLATISFDYSSGAKMTADDRMLNPLGFQVREYRIDQESETTSKAEEKTVFPSEIK